MKKEEMFNILNTKAYLCSNKLKNVLRSILYNVRDKENRKMYEYPETIQLPITWLCNFDCVMCGMHHLIQRKDFTPQELKDILNDKLFMHIKGVGINGGEPFLKPDLLDYIEVIIEALPELKNIYMISNGYFTENTVSMLRSIKVVCEKRNIKLNLSLSVDGINDMQDFMRGHKNAFRNVDMTCKAILEDKARLVDYLNIICTITRHNIARINEVELWAENYGVDVAYNIATANVRIDNFDKISDFSVFYDEESRMLAQEFFYMKYRETKSPRYFAIYLFILNNQKRFAPCDCQYNRWVTLTPDGQIGYCATHSRNLGSALENSAYELFNGQTDYLEEIKEGYCGSCSHYADTLDKKGWKLFWKEHIRMTDII